MRRVLPSTSLVQTVVINTSISERMDSIYMQIFQWKGSIECPTAGSRVQLLYMHGVSRAAFLESLLSQRLLFMNFGRTDRGK